MRLADPGSSRKAADRAKALPRLGGEAGADPLSVHCPGPGVWPPGSRVRSAAHDTGDGAKQMSPSLVGVGRTGHGSLAHSRRRHFPVALCQPSRGQHELADPKKVDKGAHSAPVHGIVSEIHKMIRLVRSMLPHADDASASDGSHPRAIHAMRDQITDSTRSQWKCFIYPL
jgi:hypothetical protein